MGWTECEKGVKLNTAETVPFLPPNLSKKFSVILDFEDKDNKGTAKLPPTK